MAGNIADRIICNRRSFLAGVENCCISKFQSGVVDGSGPVIPEAMSMPLGMWFMAGNRTRRLAASIKIFG
jgi:hypothetical protein